MSNSAQTLNPNQKQQGQKDQYSNQSNDGRKNEENNSKVGNNIRKNEPTAQNRTGGMKDEGGSCSSDGNSSQSDRKSSNA